MWFAENHQTHQFYDFWVLGRVLEPQNQYYICFTIVCSCTFAHFGMLLQVDKVRGSSGFAFPGWQVYSRIRVFRNSCSWIGSQCCYWWQCAHRSSEAVTPLSGRRMLCDINLLGSCALKLLHQSFGDASCESRSSYSQRAGAGPRTDATKYAAPTPGSLRISGFFWRLLQLHSFGICWDMVANASS